MSTSIEEGIELPKVEADVEEPDDEWLYESHRDPGKQLIHYLRYQGRTFTRKRFVPGLRAARERAGLSQKDLGKLVGLGRHAIANYERGEIKRGRVQPEMLHKLAAALGVEVGELLRAEV